MACTSFSRTRFPAFFTNCTFFRACRRLLDFPPFFTGCTLHVFTSLVVVARFGLEFWLAEKAICVCSEWPRLAHDIRYRIVSSLQKKSLQTTGLKVWILWNCSFSCKLWDQYTHCVYVDNCEIRRYNINPFLALSLGSPSLLKLPSTPSLTYWWHNFSDLLNVLRETNWFRWF